MIVTSLLIVTCIVNIPSFPSTSSFPVGIIVELLLHFYFADTLIKISATVHSEPFLKQFYYMSVSRGGRE